MVGLNAENNFRFPGQYYDSETGLHYNWHRYYDPKTGRYLTPDPIGLDGGINLFVYALNNPVNFVDPWGLKKGGIFIPIRRWIKKNIGVGDIVGPIVDQIVSIPYTPGAAFLYIMAPKEIGKGSDNIPYVRP
ncbi:MAG: hypothetical protein DSY90_13590, partial [Deltaproteobacteria bacterium]